MIGLKAEVPKCAPYEPRSVINYWLMCRERAPYGPSSVVIADLSIK